MVRLESRLIDLGARMPDFSLLDPAGDRYSRDDVAGDVGTLIVFTCNHCPYALAIWPRLIRLAVEAGRLGIGTVAINPNIHPDYPDDSPEAMAQKCVEWGIPFPYLVDESQTVARAYGAVCTPDLYLTDHSHRLVYHGRLDDHWKDEKQVTHRSLWEAIESLSDGIPFEGTQHPSMGCSIKWR